MAQIPADDLWSVVSKMCSLASAWSALGEWRRRDVALDQAEELLKHQDLIGDHRQILGLYPRGGIVAQMPKKTSLYLDDVTTSILARRDGHSPLNRRSQGRRSQLMRELIRRYDEICEKDIPVFPAEEWELIVNSARNLPSETDASTIFTTLIDACRREHRDALLKRIIDLTYGERFAVIDAVERHWTAVRRREASAA